MVAQDMFICLEMLEILGKIFILDIVLITGLPKVRFSLCHLQMLQQNIFVTLSIKVNTYQC